MGSCVWKRADGSFLRVCSATISAAAPKSCGQLASRVLCNTQDGVTPHPPKTIRNWVAVMRLNIVILFLTKKVIG